MGYSYETIDGERVEVNVAAAFKALRAAFRARFGLDLLVSSGTRTRADQERLYHGWINRLPGFNLAAKPGTSNHEETGPRGPRALDLRDSGGDPGVTRIGTVRSNWLAANAPAYGFTPAGHNFTPREGWHYEYTRPVGIPRPAASGSGSVSTPTSTPDPLDIEEEEENMNSGFYYTRAADGAIVYLIVNTTSGIWHEYTDGGRGVAIGGDYNNPIAATMRTGSYAKITESHAKVIKAKCDAASKVTVSGSVAVIDKA